MNQPTEVDEFLVFVRQANAPRDVSRVNRDGSRVARCVLIPSVERRYKCRGERQAGPAKSLVCCSKPARRLLLLPIEVEKPLSGERGNEEDQHELKRVGVVRVEEEPKDRNIERQYE